MKLSIRTIILLSAVLLVGTSIGHAGNDYTGCLTPGGTIIKVAPGKTPAKPCRENQTIIHLDGRVAQQTFDIHWNPAAVCEALRTLAIKTPEADINTQLEGLGCPSVNVAVPEEKPLKQVFFPDFTNNDNDALGCGIMKLATNREEFGLGTYIFVDGGSTQDPAGPEGGFVAKHKRYLFGPDAKTSCELLCDSDEKCIGAFLNESAQDLLWNCYTFHYTDGVDIPWNRFAGFGVDGDFGAGGGLFLNAKFWIRDCTD